MTEVIRYEELTYPEVAELPRNTPMLIPLGEADGYDWVAVADRVREQTRRRVDRACVFPGVPFGFRTREPSLKSLAVDPKLMQRVLASLVATIKEDGFTRVFVIDGHGPQGCAGRDVPMLNGAVRDFCFAGRQKRLRIGDDPTDISSELWEVGVRVPVGMSVMHDGFPLEGFLELVPGLGIAPRTQAFFEAAVGARFYFGKKQAVPTE